MGSKLVIAGKGTVAEIADIFTRLDRAGVEPTGFNANPPTLDDVFLTLTGRSLREGGTETPLEV